MNKMKAAQISKAGGDLQLAERVVWEPDYSKLGRLP